MAMLQLALANAGILLCYPESYFIVKELLHRVLYFLHCRLGHIQCGTAAEGNQDTRHLLLISLLCQSHVAVGYSHGRGPPGGHAGEPRELLSHKENITGSFANTIILYC